MANSERLKHAAFYTRQDICFSLIESLPDFQDKETITILEPSVGVGNFLPQLIRKYKKNKKIIIDLVDIDCNALDVLKLLIKKLNVPNNFSINLINDDFLIHRFSQKYDILIGNPPFGKVEDKSSLIQYQEDVYNTDTKNIFAFFIEKAFKIADNVALIVPKSMMSAPEFDKTRDLLSTKKFIKISDFGEKGFKGVKIETIGFVVKNAKVGLNNLVKIESLIDNSAILKEQIYIFDPKYPYWLIYRNDHFDSVAKRINFNIFKPYRDRQITKKHTTLNFGKYRVLKSRNIGNNEIISLSGYDSYINSLSGLSISKFLNISNAVLIPNLSYYPRATFKPSGCVTDGSVAILLPKDEELKISQNQLEYFSTEEFKIFYRIARNFGTRSLNIDKNSVFFWGLPIAQL